MTVKYHWEVQDSKQLPTHIHQIQQWDLDVSELLCELQGKSSWHCHCVADLCQSPFLTCETRLGLLCPALPLLLDDPHRLDLQNFIPGHPRELSWQVLSFLGLPICAGQNTWKATREGRESPQFLLPVSHQVVAGVGKGSRRSLLCLSFHWVSQLSLVFLGILFSLPFLKTGSLSKCCVCFTF